MDEQGGPGATSGGRRVSEKPTVLVVGGGATGAGVARDLSLRGVDVTLVERGGLGGGTSGRSHGVLHSGARYAESDPTGAEECIEENRVIREVASECVSDTGGLFVRLPEDDPDRLDELVAAYGSPNPTDADVVTRD